MDDVKNVNVGGNPPAEKKDNKTLMGVLAYLGPLVVIPYATAKDDPFVKFHIKQGLVLLVLEVVLWILSSMMWSWSLWPLYNLLNLAIVVLSILGIVNVVQNKEKELPLVGQFSHYFTF